MRRRALDRRTRRRSWRMDRGMRRHDRPLEEARRATRVLCRVLDRCVAPACDLLARGLARLARARAAP